MHLLKTFDHTVLNRAVSEANQWVKKGEHNGIIKIEVIAGGRFYVIVHYRR